MNWQPLLGLVLVLYGAFCIFVGATKKPDNIWEMMCGPLGSTGHSVVGRSARIDDGPHGSLAETIDLFAFFVLFVAIFLHGDPASSCGARRLHGTGHPPGLFHDRRAGLFHDRADVLVTHRPLLE